MLTALDETDLLLPLFSGASEEVPFTSFLERLRRRAGVISASLTIRLRPGHEGVVLFVGPDLRQRASELQLKDLNLADRIQYDRLRPGRVYSGDEFIDHDPVSKARRAHDMRKLGLADERVVRLLDEEAASAWLILASTRPCTATHTAMLSSLMPYVAAAVRSFVVSERQRLAAALDDEGLRRAGSGWIMFDSAARILALAPSTAQALSQAIGRSLRLGERPRELGPAVERALSEAAANFAQDRGGKERALVLCRQPTVQALLSSFPNSAGALETPVMVAHCRHTRAPVISRDEHLSRLYGLPRREAQLAIQLADGLSLAEAASVMGLTIETTRNYSKRLFATLGVRGQPGLVRAVHESCAVLAS